MIALRSRRILLAICFGLVMTVAATAQTVYSNGPINGETDAFTINFGFVVSNTFTVSQPSQITGLSFGAWLQDSTCARRQPASTPAILPLGPFG